MSAPDTRSDGLHSVTVGDGRAPVVFCHGLFGRGKNFTTTAKALLPEHTSVLLDMPDHGQSRWTERFNYEVDADLVAAAMRDGVAADGPVDLVGHSMGGKIAMLVALRHPGLVRRLVVSDIGPGASSANSEFEHLLGALAEIDLRTLGSLGEADRALAVKVPQPVLRGFLLQNLRRTRGEDGRQEFFWQPNLELLRRDLPTIMGAIPTQGRSWDGPVLWLKGQRSDYVRAEDGELMRSFFPRAVQVTVKGAGHWLHSDAPEAFVATLRHFLRDG